MKYAILKSFASMFMVNVALSVSTLKGESPYMLSYLPSCHAPRQHQNMIIFLLLLVINSFPCSICCKFTDLKSST